MEVKCTFERKFEIAVGFLIWIVVAGLIGFTRDLPYMQEGAPGPRFLPMLVAVILGFLNVTYFTEILFSKRAKPLALPSLPELVFPALYVLVGAFMTVAWERLGVVPTVLLACFFELKFLEGYPWRKSFFAGVAASVTTWMLFKYILGVELPAGILAWLLR